MLKIKTQDYSSGNSQLLIDYREALIAAFELGEDIKELYGIVPPKILHDKKWDVPTGIKANNIVIALAIS